MEHDQQILSGSRYACSFAIGLVWIIEILFLTALIAVVVFTLLDQSNSLFPDIPIAAVMLGCAMMAIVSIAVTGMAIASMANAIANIDNRNIQLENLWTIRQQQHRSLIAPARDRRTADIDTMRINPERVT